MPTSTLPLHHPLLAVEDFDFLCINPPCVTWHKPAGKFVLLAPVKRSNAVPVRLLVGDSVTATHFTGPASGDTDTPPTSVAVSSATTTPASTVHEPGESLCSWEQEPHHRPREVRAAMELHDEETQAQLMTTLEVILAHRWKFLGAGVYGATYSCGPYWAIKIARNDGTRQYLEWCWAMQKQGKGMPGMPQIDFISDLTSRTPYNAEPSVGKLYAVGMKRYRPARGKLRNFGIETFKTQPFGMDCIPFREPNSHGLYFEPIYAIHKRAGCPQYLVDLVSTCERQFGEGFANDVHSGNLMIDMWANQLILTDPSSRRYPYLDDRHLSSEFKLTSPL